MAITFYTALDERYGLFEQSAWGTAPTAGAAYTELHVEPDDIQPGVSLRRPPRARAQRTEYLPDMQADQKGQEHVFPYKGPFHLEIAAKLLYGVMQNVTESATSADGWAKDYSYSSTQPDFTANAGKFFGLCKRMPVASNSKLVSDAIFRNLLIESKPGEGEDSILMAGGDLVGRAYSAVYNPTGTWTIPTQTNLSFYDNTTKTLAGTDVVLGDGGWSLNFINNARKIGGSSASFDTFGLGKYSVEVSINLLWDATTRTAMASALAGTVETLILEWGTVDTTGHLKFDLDCVWDAAPIESAEEGTFVTLTGKAGKTSGGSVPEVTLSDGVDRSF